LGPGALGHRIVDDDRGALAGEEPCDARPGVLPGSGDQSDLAGQVEHASALGHVVPSGSRAKHMLDRA
jgi:hypothetical protein